MQKDLETMHGARKVSFKRCLIGNWWYWISDSCGWLDESPKDQIIDGGIFRRCWKNQSLAAQRRSNCHGSIYLSCFTLRITACIWKCTTRLLAKTSCSRSISNKVGYRKPLWYSCLRFGYQQSRRRPDVSGNPQEHSLSYRRRIQCHEIHRLRRSSLLFTENYRRRLLVCRLLSRAVRDSNTRHSSCTSRLRIIYSCVQAR